MSQPVQLKDTSDDDTRVTDTASELASGAAGTVGGAAKGRNKKPLHVCLDLNLEVEIELQARVHGDVTLSLLC